MLEKAVLGMALLRILSGCLELLAAGLMIKFNQVEKAIIINSLLAVVGPLILISTTTIGLIGIADRVSLSKLVLILLGVALILIGIRK
ncbi:MAG: YqhV family protein [Bacillaceae bacterium]|nr:YqhV family protein [Bacillaceae bacterium]